MNSYMQLGIIHRRRIGYPEKMLKNQVVQTRLKAAFGTFCVISAHYI